MAEKKNIPEIRFEGFDEGWEQMILGQHSIIKGRLGWKSLKQEEYLNEGPSMIAGRHINNGTIDWSVVDHIPDWRYYESPEIMLKENDVIFSKDGSLGNPAVIKNLKTKATINSTMMLVRLKDEINSDFFYQVLRTKQFDDLIKLKVSGSSIPHLFQADMQKFVFSAPKTTEQSQIGTYFQNLDKLIFLYKKKCDKLIILKKAMLEKMFPKNGASIPEIRFKGFIGDWDEKRLGDNGNTFTGLSGKTKDDFGHGEGKFVTYMNVFSNPVSNPAMTESVVIDNYQNSVQYGDVFFTTSSETPEEVGMSSVWLGNTENIYLNSFCFGYRMTIGADPYFIAYLLRSNYVRNKIIFLAQGISRFNISKKKVMDITIPIPTLDEQVKVGKYFMKLDRAIALHQKELGKLKIIKKACLEKMFV